MQSLYFKAETWKQHLYWHVPWSSEATWNTFDSFSSPVTTSTSCSSTWLCLACCKAADSASVGWGVGDAVASLATQHSTHSLSAQDWHTVGKISPNTHTHTHTRENSVSVSQNILKSTERQQTWITLTAVNILPTKRSAAGGPKQTGQILLTKHTGAPWIGRHQIYANTSCVDMGV